MQVFLAGEYYKNMGNAIKQIVWGGIVPDDAILSKPSHPREIQGGASTGVLAVRGRLRR